ncbi:methyltransferase domain-containing protein [bacterium]|nr:methyltransferase domain-containing protein [bacterium]
MMETLFEMFSRLPRQGPGLDEMTTAVYHALPLTNGKPKILDIGCGTGYQTMALARATKGSIVATDIHPPYLEKVMEEARKVGVTDRISTHASSMDQLELPEGSFDLIWAEGSIFAIGFEKGIRDWNRLLAPGGCLVVSEITWFCPDPPKEIRDYFESVECPVLDEIDARKIAEDAGYEVLDTRRLDPKGWWEKYYTPYVELAPTWEAEADANPDLKQLIEEMMLEIDMFRKYSEFYGYTFYMLKKKS